MQRMKNGIDRISGAKLQPIIPLKFFPLDPLTIDESAVFAPLVLNEETAVFGDKQSVVARYARIANNKVLVHLAANGKRRVIKVKGPLLASVYKNEARKNSRGNNGNRNGALGAHCGNSLLYKHNASKSLMVKAPEKLNGLPHPRRCSLRQGGDCDFTKPLCAPAPPFRMIYPTPVQPCKSCKRA